MTGRSRKRATARAWLLAAWAVGAGARARAADEFSGADKLRSLYSAEFRFTEQGEPVVPVAIIEGATEVTITGDGGLRLLPEGDGGPEIRADDTWLGARPGHDAGAATLLVHRVARPRAAGGAGRGRAEGLARPRTAGADLRARDALRRRGRGPRSARGAGRRGPRRQLRGRRARRRATAGQAPGARERGLHRARRSAARIARGARGEVRSPGPQRGRALVRAGLRPPAQGRVAAGGRQGAGPGHVPRAGLRDDRSARRHRGGQRRP